MTKPKTQPGTWIGNVFYSDRLAERRLNTLTASEADRSADLRTDISAALDAWSDTMPCDSQPPETGSASDPAP